MRIELFGTRRAKIRNLWFILFTIGSLDLLLIAQGLICFHFLRQLIYSDIFLVTGPWSPFDYCHILEVFAVPVVTQPVLSAFVMAAALGLLRVRRAGGLRSDEPLEKTAHRLLCEWRRCRHVLRQTINLLLEKDSKFSIVSIEYRVIWRNLLLIYNRPTVPGIPTTRVLWNQFREKAPDLCINYFWTFKRRTVFRERRRRRRRITTPSELEWALEPKNQANK